jgi:hypothetical protein
MEEEIMTYVSIVMMVYLISNHIIVDGLIAKATTV